MSNYEMTNEGLVENAAAACQERDLTDNKYVQEAIILNCIGPLRERIAELEHELEAYKKDNAYLIDQLPIQKHQKYLEGLEAAALEVLKVGGPGYEYLAASIRALKEEP